MGWFCRCFGSLSICSVKLCPITFGPFGWIWADGVSLRTSVFSQLLLSSVASSLNTNDPLEAKHVHAVASDHELFQTFFIRHLGAGWSSFPLSQEYWFWILFGKSNLEVYVKPFVFCSLNSSPQTSRCCLLSIYLGLSMLETIQCIFFPHTKPNRWFGHS